MRKLLICIIVLAYCDAFAQRLTPIEMEGKWEGEMQEEIFIGGYGGFKIHSFELLLTHDASSEYELINENPDLNKGFVGIAKIKGKSISGIPVAMRPFGWKSSMEMLITGMSYINRQTGNPEFSFKVIAILGKGKNILHSGILSRIFKISSKTKEGILLESTESSNLKSSLIQTSKRILTNEIEEILATKNEIVLGIHQNGLSYFKNYEKPAINVIGTNEKGVISTTISNSTGYKIYNISSVLMPAIDKKYEIYCTSQFTKNLDTNLDKKKINLEELSENQSKEMNVYSIKTGLQLPKDLIVFNESIVLGGIVIKPKQLSIRVNNTYDNEVKLAYETSRQIKLERDRKEEIRDSIQLAISNENNKIFKETNGGYKFDNYTAIKKSRRVAIKQGRCYGYNDEYNWENLIYKTEITIYLRHGVEEKWGNYGTWELVEFKNCGRRERYGVNLSKKKFMDTPNVLSMILDIAFDDFTTNVYFEKIFEKQSEAEEAIVNYVRGNKTFLKK